MRRLPLVVAASLALCLAVHSEDRKIYLKRPQVSAGAGLSESEVRSIGEAFQSQLTLRFMERGGFELRNDDDLEALLEEAEMKAMLDCDASECLLAVAERVGARYLVQTRITVTGKAKARVDAQYSEKTQTNDLRVIGIADVSECNPFDSGQVKWYAREIVNKLLDVRYEVKPYLAETVGVRIELGTAQSIQLKSLSGASTPIIASLPEVKVEVSGDTASQVSSILKESISQADALARDLKLSEAEEAYRKVQDKALRYKEAYPDIGEFEGIITNRIGELRRLSVEKRIADADSLADAQKQLLTYRETERFRAGVEPSFAALVASYAPVITSRISDAHRREIKGILDRGDSLAGAAKPAEAAQAYQQAASYLASNAAEIGGRGSDISPFIDQRLLVAFGSMVASSLSEAERHYMDYEFGSAEDAFTAALKTAQSCPLYAAASSLPTGGGTPEQQQFASLVQAATEGARKSRETALNIFRNQASVYKDKVTIFDARDEIEQAERALEEMGSYIGSSRYRADAVALGHLKAACVIRRRQPDALLLATAEVRAAIKDNGIAVKAGSAYVLVQTDGGAAGSVAVSVSGAPTTRAPVDPYRPGGGYDASANDSLGSIYGKGSTAWRATWPGARRIEVGTISQTLDLAAGHFYRITAYPSLPLRSYLTSAAGLPGYRAPPTRPALIQLLTTAVGLQGYKAPPPVPNYLEEYRYRARNLTLVLGFALLSPFPGALVGGVPALLINIDNPDLDAVGRAFLLGSLVGGGVLTLLFVALTPQEDLSSPRPLAWNIASNARRRAAWEAAKRPIDDANQHLLDEENRRREAENQRLLAEWQKQVGPIEQANNKLLDDANARIRAENLVIQEKNRDRGRIEVVDIGSYEAVTMP